MATSALDRAAAAAGNRIAQAVSGTASATGGALAVGALTSRAARSGNIGRLDAAAAGEQPSVLWGGVTRTQAKQIHDELMGLQLARKNIWHVEVVDRHPPQGFDGIGRLFNLLALDAGYAPCTMPGESVPIGSAVMDHLTGTERVEMRFATMDDEKGTVKRWLQAKAAQAANRDGTFGLPSHYCFNVTISHMDPLAENLRGQFKDRRLMRLGSYEVELSRREQALEELQITFTEFDTFLGL